MRVALIGFGRVGKAFVKLLFDKKDYLAGIGLDISLDYIINSSGGVHNPSGIDYMDILNHDVSGGRLLNYPHGGSPNINFDYLLDQGGVDLLIEATPTCKETGEPGMTHVRKALENRIHVVTANKGPVLKAYRSLYRLAAQKGIQLCVGCTTGGALPAINTGIFDLAGAKILSIKGILNGTTNFILDEMERHGIQYREALRKAQQMGIAETDPTLDVEGWDTATKLVILTNILMEQDISIEDVIVEGITGITPEDVVKASQEGKRYKLIGEMTRLKNGIQAKVGLEKISKDHPLYGVSGTNKAVMYLTDTMGLLTVIGGASGTVPAAASILRDIVNLHRGYRFSYI